MSLATRPAPQPNWDTAHIQELWGDADEPLPPPPRRRIRPLSHQASRMEESIPAADSPRLSFVLHQRRGRALAWSLLETPCQKPFADPHQRTSHSPPSRKFAEHPCLYHPAAAILPRVSLPRPPVPQTPPSLIPPWQHLQDFWSPATQERKEATFFFFFPAQWGKFLSEKPRSPPSPTHFQAFSPSRAMTQEKSGGTATTTQLPPSWEHARAGGGERLGCKQLSCTEYPGSGFTFPGAKPSPWLKSSHRS